MTLRRVAMPCTQHKASRKDDLGHLRWLDQHLNGVALDSINRDALDKLIQAKLETGAGNATVNRMLALIRSILRKAALEWEWLDKVPKIRLLPEPSRRIRWITREEVDRLLSGTAEAFECHGPVQFGNGTTASQRHRLAMVTDRPDPALCLDTP